MEMKADRRRGRPGHSRGPMAFIASSLRAKIVAIFAVTTIIPIALVGIVSFSSANSALRAQTTASAIQIAGQLTTNIDLMFRDSERFLRIGNHQTTVDFLSPTGQTEERTYRLALEIIDLFKLFRDIYEFDERIRGIYILGFNGNHISEREGRLTLEEDLAGIPVVARILRGKGEIVYTHQEQVPYSRSQSYGDVISIGKAIVRPVTRDTLGVIIVDVDARSLRALSESIKIGQTGYFSIVATDRSFIFPEDEVIEPGHISDETIHTIAAGENGHMINATDGEQELIVFDTFRNANWKIVGRVRLSEIMGSAHRIRSVTVSAMMLAMIVTVILHFFISDAITQPLRVLTGKMKEAERGNLDVRAHSRNGDEIADLCHSFNVMIEEIRMLLSRSVQEEENRKKFELKALQAQINPHFLYNTLDAIVWMTEANDRRSVVSTTKALSSFFRIALSKGQEWITIRDEQEHIRNYLLIQKMRHRDLLDYDIDFDPGILDCTILKLMLQPIVENAIEHGIQNKRGGGRVAVSGHSNGNGSLVFEVRDDGCGIPTERMAAVQAELGEEIVHLGKEHGFGLKNVNQRIRLYYGRQWGLEVESTPGQGTSVCVHLPVRQPEDANV